MNSYKVALSLLAVAYGRNPRLRDSVPDYTAASLAKDGELQPTVEFVDRQLERREFSDATFNFDPTPQLSGLVYTYNQGNPKSSNNPFRSDLVHEEVDKGGHDNVIPDNNSDPFLDRIEDNTLDFLGFCWQENTYTSFYRRNEYCPASDKGCVQKLSSKFKGDDVKVARSSGETDALLKSGVQLEIYSPEGTVWEEVKMPVGWTGKGVVIKKANIRGVDVVLTCGHLEKKDHKARVEAFTRVQEVVEKTKRDGNGDVAAFMFGDLNFRLQTKQVDVSGGKTKKQVVEDILTDYGTESKDRDPLSTTNIAATLKNETTNIAATFFKCDDPLVPTYPLSIEDRNTFKISRRRETFRDSKSWTHKKAKKDKDITKAKLDETITQVGEDLPFGTLDRMCVHSPLPVNVYVSHSLCSTVNCTGSDHLPVEFQIAVTLPGAHVAARKNVVKKSKQGKKLNSREKAALGAAAAVTAAAAVKYLPKYAKRAGGWKQVPKALYEDAKTLAKKAQKGANDLLFKWE